MPSTFTPSITSSTTGPSGFGQTTNSNVFSMVPFGSQCISAQNSSTITFGSSTPSSTTTMPCPIMLEGSSAAAVSVTSSTSPSGFGQTRNSTVPFGSQCMSAQNSSTLTFGSSTPSSTIPCPIMWGGSSSGSTSSSTSAFGQSSNANVSAPTNGVTSMGVSGMAKPFSPFASVQHSNLFSYCNTTPLKFASPGPFQSYPFNGGKTVSSSSGPKATLPSSNIRASSTDSKTDASAPKELKNQQKLQCEEMEKSVQLICEDVIRHQENMKSWTERYRSLELEKIEDTQTIIQLREELAQVTKSKDAIIAEYLESPAFTKRLNEEHEKRLSEIFHPCYVKALHTVQTKLPKKKSKRRKNLNAWHRADQVTIKEEEKEKTSI